jgi:hypothetical protein
MHFAKESCDLAVSFLFDQLLKLLIIAQRIPHRIDSQKRRREWRVRQSAEVMGLEKFWQASYGARCFTGLSFDDCQHFLGGGTDQ